MVTFKIKEVENGYILKEDNEIIVFERIPDDKSTYEMNKQELKKSKKLDEKILNQVFAKVVMIMQRDRRIFNMQSTHKFKIIWKTKN